MASLQDFLKTRLFLKHVTSGDPLEAKVDASGSQVQITHQHSKVHQGVYYGVTHLFETVGNNSTADILIKCSASYENHAVIVIGNEGNCKLQVFETPDLGGNGTAIDIVNHNRSSANVSSSTAFHTPSLNSPFTYGASLFNGGLFLPGGTKDKGGGALSTAAGEQWVWAKSKNYLVRVTNISGSAQNISIDIAFYEVA